MPEETVLGQPPESMDSKIANAADANTDSTDSDASQQEVPRDVEFSEKMLQDAISVLKEASDRRAGTIRKDAATNAAAVLEKWSIKTGNEKTGLLRQIMAGLLDISAGVTNTLDKVLEDSYKKNDSRMKNWIGALTDVYARQKGLDEGGDIASRKHHNELFRVKTEKGWFGSLKDTGEKMRLTAVKAAIKTDMWLLRANGERQKGSADTYKGITVGLRKMSSELRGENK